MEIALIFLLAVSIGGIVLAYHLGIERGKEL